MSVNKKTMKKIIGAVAVGTGVAFVSLSILARKQKPDSVYKNNPEQKNPFEGSRQQPSIWNRLLLGLS